MRQRRFEKQSTKEVLDLVKDYATYSTIQGFVHIFLPNQKLVGKVFWVLIVIGLTILGTYW